MVHAIADGNADDNALVNASVLLAICTGEEETHANWL